VNRRRTVKPHLSFGSIALLIVAAIVMASAGVFHAYIKNRQINVSREIQRVEDTISQYQLDIATDKMFLADQLNSVRIRARLKEISSDLRSIPQGVVKEVLASPRILAQGDSSPESLPALASAPSESDGPAVASVP
jgi:cell division protein FtsL